jgi:hypothetical protein
MWATQDELSNDVANYLFYFILIPPPPLQGLFLPQMDFIKQTQAIYTPNHTNHFSFSFFLVSFSIYLILKVIGIWLGDNLDPENPHAHKYTHTKSRQRDLKYFQFIYRID